MRRIIPLLTILLVFSLTGCTFTIGGNNDRSPQMPDLQDIPEIPDIPGFQGMGPRAFAGGQAPLTIGADGTGLTSAAPDVAYLNIGVHTEDPDAATAVDANSAVVKKVREAVNEWGVEDKDIQTSNFSIYQSSPYTYDPTLANPPKVISVDNTVLVTVRDLKNIGKMLGAAVDAGANNIYSVYFDVENKEALYEQARVKAFENAARQAQQYAELAGGELGGVLHVGPVDNTYYPMYEGMGGGGAAPQNLTNVPISAGMIQVSVAVRVVYALEYR